MLRNLLIDPLITRDANYGPDFVALAAFQFTLLGDVDDAIDALESALAVQGGNSLRSMMQIPGMDVLEQHPRFTQLVERFGWVKEDKSLGVKL